MRQFRTVMAFEYKSYVSSKAFIAVTVIFVLIALIGPTIPTIVSAVSGRSQAGQAAAQKAAVVDDSGGIFSADTLGKYMPAYAAVYYNTVGEACDAVKGGDAKLAVVFGDGGNPYAYALYFANMTLMDVAATDTFDSLVKRVYLERTMQDLGATRAQIDAAANFAPTSRTENITASGDAAAGSLVGNAVFAYILVYILLITLIMYGQYIVMSVIREKSTKTMELLITSAKPIHLIFGKVVGVCLAGFTQIACLAAAGVVSLKLNAMFLASNRLGPGIGGALGSMLSISPALVVYLFAFFLTGFFTYAFLYAAFASTASRMEDANSIAVLPMLLLMASFFISIIGMTNSQSTAVVVCSFIPFFAPMAMYMRLCLGTATNAQALAAIGISVVCIFGVALVSAKIYRMGVLMYGKPPKLGAIAKALVTPEKTKK
ncbi:MAG: ABC transporter permease [Firmicutes bacterium]|nr:ABC transporter permease [Bacillota bacterium]